ncbi:MAG: peptide MFS transporter [Phocaeicola sp.]
MNNTTKGHPKGLYMLFVTEMWERFSYYGMRALFILYMIQALLFNKELASSVYGSYTGLVYLTPLLGGYISDRYWGNRRSIFWGAMIMALGQFLMFLSAWNYENLEMAIPFMYLGLGVLVMGNGLFKPNISTMVGSLYEANDKRKDSAFTIFYMGVNLGATIAPLWCGWVGNTGNPADFKWGFLSSCIGMLIAAVVFQIFKNKYLHRPDGTPVGLPPVKKEVTKVEGGKKEAAVSPLRLVGTLALGALLFLLFSINWESFNNVNLSLFEGVDWIGSTIYTCVIVMPLFIITDKSLSTIEKKRIGVIYIIAFFVIFFWAAFEQAGASLTFFADEQTDRFIGNWEMPTTYFQSFNAIFIVVLAPVFASLWVFLGKKGMEPASPVKQSIGLFLLAMGYLIIAFGVHGVDHNVKVSMLWLTSLYLVHTMGELCLSPIGLSMVYKLSPARFSSLMMGVWYLSTSAANKLAGMLSGYYPEGGVAKNFMGYSVENLFDFFMLFVFMSGAAAVILFLLSSSLKKLMSGAE